MCVKTFDLFSLLSITVRLEDLQDIEDQDPEITPGLFEGKLETLFRESDV